MRNVAIAHSVAGGEQAAVVALVRDVYASAVENWNAGFLVQDSVLTGSCTWEKLYTVTEDRAELARLRDYMADKSVNLRPAFAL